MLVRKLSLKNFRCFPSSSIQFPAPMAVITGSNGAGKTSLLEAMNYACYSQSFRTRHSHELVREGEAYFYLELEVESDGELHTIQVGYTTEEGDGQSSKLVKLNGKEVESLREIIRHYRVITVVGDDLELVRGYPELRRALLNQSLFLDDQVWASVFRQFKRVLAQRNELLAALKEAGKGPDATLKTWTEQLWQLSKKIQDGRVALLKNLESKVTELLANYFSNDKLTTTLRYEYKEISPEKDFETLWLKLSETLTHEIGAKRSLFGAHLDDFAITLHGRCARTYASRGEQKLLVLLLKCAQLLLANKSLPGHQQGGILLLDDFLTDLDNTRLTTATEMIRDLGFHAIITSPIPWSNLQSHKSVEELHI